MQTLRLIAVMLVAIALGDHIANNGAVTNAVLHKGEAYLDRIFDRLF